MIAGPEKLCWPKSHCKFVERRYQDLLEDTMTIPNLSSTVDDFRSSCCPIEHTQVPRASPDGMAPGSQLPPFDKLGLYSEPNHRGPIMDSNGGLLHIEAVEQYR